MKHAIHGTIGFDVLLSPIGPIHVVVDERGVRKVAVTEEEWEEYKEELGSIPQDSELCKEAIRQLQEYFNGDRRQFDLPLAVEGTEFRKRVWQQLQSIPYGEVRSYKEIASAVGKPKAPRAVGQANRANPLPILIPCHRVIGASGNLVGYAGTRTDIKSVLLRLEGAVPQSFPTNTK
ncbi:methylated-DNA--[protein]-cysteine S-methyltransferase [Effusibacillus lacus]|uniref:Methylated-DNA--protein-cysteine methyltransferase n=1 Tax=Effusibacillus lacus TaxID=1348429 RepID=A0A292YSP8_9BACL|nr:methylated-DNA--[protein]-cysteine S-methyltransferase [Effusibacillus lacus]TCS73557.1 methylated-DNA-[protein]-cysteine S-methyltransferase [Effusibacillus lacus]GAX91949.1 cysteine methyltransferase [Effusibacillus lacus]